MSDDKNSNVHSGRRQRVREKFSAHGLDVFTDHEVLELLLYYSIPRIDTNPLAHRLIDTFGSLSGVFEATEAELRSVDGVTDATVTLLRLMPQMFSRYNIAKATLDFPVRNVETAGHHLMPFFERTSGEVVYIMCLDIKGRHLYTGLAARGNVNSAAMQPGEIARIALERGASCVILAHNHPSGSALPSEADVETTRRIADVLKAVDIALVDHLIIADGDFISMADCGYI